MIENCGAQGKSLPPDRSSRPNDNPTRFGRRRRSAGAKHRDKRSRAAEQAEVAAPDVSEDDLWTVDEESDALDEILLIDFDEEPEILDEISSDSGEDDHEPDEADEFLDIYDLEELDDEDCANDVPGELDGSSEEGGSTWILEAFKAWMLEGPDDLVAQELADEATSQEGEGDAEAVCEDEVEVTTGLTIPCPGQISPARTRSEEWSEDLSFVVHPDWSQLPR